MSRRVIQRLVLMKLEAEIQNEDLEVNQMIQMENKSSGLKNKRPSKLYWSVEEDTNLINGWLLNNNSIDENTGRRKTNWVNIAAYVNEKRLTKSSSRSTKSCTKRWDTISKSVGKFISAVTEARRRATISGSMSERDVMALAYKLYHDDAKFGFSLAYAYDLLHDAPAFLDTLCIKKKNKWNFQLDVNHLSSAGSSKRSRLNEEDNHPDSGDLSVSEGQGEGDIESMRELAWKNLQVLGKSNRMVAEWKEVKLQEIELERAKLAFRREKLDYKVLELLLDKESLSPAEEGLKSTLYKKLFQI